MNLHDYYADGNVSKLTSLNKFWDIDFEMIFGMQNIVPNSVINRNV